MISIISFSVPLAHVVLNQKAPLIMNYSCGLIFMVFWKKAIKDTGKYHCCFSEHMIQAAEKSEEDTEARMLLLMCVVISLDAGKEK